MSAPRLYEKEINKKRFFAPIYKGGELYSFYLNFDVPITDPNFEDFRLGVYKDDVRISAIVDPLVQDMIYGISYNIYCEFIFPITVQDGCYTFCIYRESDDAIMCRSNVFVVDNYHWEKSSIFQWRNTYNKFNFNYEDHPGFFNTVRLVLIEVDSQNETEIKQYRSVSDRRLRNSAFDKDKFVKIETYKLDSEAHDAMAAIFLQDYLSINGTEYIAKGSYQVQTDLNSPLSNGSIELYEQ